MYRLPIISIKVNVEISKLKDLLSCLGWYSVAENDNPVFKKSDGATMFFNRTCEGYYLRYYCFNEKICNVNLYNCRMLHFCKTLLQIDNCDANIIELCVTFIPHINDVSVISLYELNDYLEHCNKDDGGMHPNDKERWKVFMQRVKDMNDGEAIKQGLSEVLHMYGWTDTWIQKRCELFMRGMAR